MAGDPTRKPSWKKGEPAAKGGKGGPRGFLGRERRAAPTNWSWRLKLATGLGGMFGLIALLIVLIRLFLFGTSTALVLIAAGYENNLALPQNALGKRALLGGGSGKSLSQYAEEGTRSLFLGGKPLELKAAHELKINAPWDKGLEDIREKTAIVIFSVNGATDVNGAAYFLRSDGGVEDDKERQNRLGFDAVLERLNVEALAGVNKLLILDVHPINGVWALGALKNEVIKAIEDQVKAKKVPKLIVMTGTSPNQNSWSSAEVGRSVFLHFVIEGLRGAAADTTGVVTAKSLFEWVQPRVSAWAHKNRTEPQTPMLIDEESLAAKMSLARKPLQTPEPETVAEVGLPGDLATLWQEWGTLNEEKPHPGVYAPMWWRLHTLALLRYEELAALGDSSAGSLRELAQKCLGPLREARYYNQSGPESFKVASYGLAVPGAFGETRSPRLDAVEAELAQRLWSDSSNRNRIWQEVIRTNPKPSLRQRLRREFIHRATEDFNEDNFKRLVDLVQVLDEASEPRPTEAHFVVMLHRHLVSPLPMSVPWPSIGQALRVRLLAEEAALNQTRDDYAYAEAIAPWLREELELADQTRREGEDLLFALDFTEAESKLRTAEEKFRELRSQGQKLAAAMTLRDRVMSELPFDSWYLAQRLTADAQRLAEVKVVKDAWDEVHELDRLLVVMPERSTDRVAAVDSVEKKRASLDAHYRELVRRRESWVQKEEVTGQTPEDWQGKRDLLSLPFMRWDKRKALLDGMRKISNQLHVASMKDVADGVAKDARTTSEKELATLVDDRARRHGELATAALGRNWFGHTSRTRAGQYGYDATQQRVVADKFSEVGQELLIRSQSLVAEVQTLTRESRALSSAVEARQLLTQAAEWARLFWGQVSPATLDQLTKDHVNPTQRLRELDLANLLGLQARRTLKDFWADETPGKDAYFQRVGREYVAQAKGLVVGDLTDISAKQERTKPLDQLDSQLRQKPELTLTPADEGLFLTSETTLEVPFQVAAGAGVPEGFPAAWTSLADSSFVAIDAKRLRLPLDLSKERRQADVVLGLANKALAAGPNSLGLGQTRQERIELTTLFRGHLQKKPLDLLVQPWADVVWTDPRPVNKAALAVRADDSVGRRFGNNNSAITIVLDCSGSMIEANDKVPLDPANRYPKALEAIDRFLARIPPDTQVSFWIFSQRTGDPAIDNAEAGGLPSRRVEESLQRIFQPQPWRTELRTSILERLRSLTPSNFTPLVHSLMKARKDLEDVRGFKTLVVLTDGMDTCFRVTNQQGKVIRTDPVFNADGSKDIPTFIREQFKDSDIALRIVGFQLPEQEKKQAEPFISAVKEVGGKFDLVDSPESLNKVLDEARLRDLYYFVFRGNGQLVVPNGTRAKRVREEPTWLNLEPADYRVALGKQLEKQRVSLLDGQALLLDAMIENDQLRFRRAVMGNDSRLGPLTDSERWEKDGWLLTVPQNCRIPGGQEVLLTVESLPKRSLADDIVEHQVPRLAWLEFKPGGDLPRPAQVRWGYQPGIPAPAWRVRAFWPKGMAVPETRLEAWWADRQEPLDQGRFEQGRDYRRSPVDLRDKRLALGNLEARLDSVTFEQHELGEAREGRNLQKRDYVVVRLRYPKNTPVFVRLTGPGVDAGGTEHHFYTQANKYTGYFPMNRAQADQITSLRFYSIAAFKGDKDQTLNSGPLKLDRPNDQEYLKRYTPPVPLPEDAALAGAP